jgi:uncharacterized membrane protein YdcZ (DUF606 family)
MITKLGVVVLYAPTFLLPSILVAVVGGWLGTIYLKAQLSVKREMSNTKAPVLGVLGSAISGLGKEHFCNSHWPETLIKKYKSQPPFVRTVRKTSSGRKL